MRAAVENERRFAGCFDRYRSDGHLVAAVVIAVLALLVVALLPAAALADTALYEKSIGPDGTEATGFGEAVSVAVDQKTDALYVLDRQPGDPTKGALLKFDLDGQPVPFGGSAPYISGNEITGLALDAGIARNQVAVDSKSHHFYVTTGNSIKAFHADGEPAVFSSGPGAGTNTIEGFEKISGLAVDANGAIYASDGITLASEGEVKIYSHDGDFLTQLSHFAPANLAVDTNGNIFTPFDGGLEVMKRLPSQFPVTAATTYDHAGCSSCAYLDGWFRSVAADPVTNEIYATHNESTPGISRYDEAGALLESFGRPGEDGEVTVAQGIAVHGEGERIFVPNTPSAGLSQVKIFQLVGYIGPPRVESISVKNVTADAAVLRAQINPGTSATSYRFEYGLGDCAVNDCASIPLTSKSIGDGDEPVDVSQAVSGLQSNTTYHYRVVAENEHGQEIGPGAGDHVFKTQTTNVGFELADRRVWEMISPPDKKGGRLIASNEGLIQGAADGNAVSYLSIGSTESDPDGSRLTERSSILAWRAGAGWTSKDVMPPNDSVTPIPLGAAGEYKLFSSDLSRALVEPRSSTLLSPQASERTPYLRQNTEPPTYTPLVTGKEGFANVPPGTEFGGHAKIGAVQVAGASPDLSHIVLQSAVSLAAGAPKESLYEWVGGELEPVSVLPFWEGGAIVPSSYIGSGPGTVRNAISEDGSRVFWQSSLGTTHLYMRETQIDETVQIDVQQPGATGAGKVDPMFQGASADGSVVFFTDSQQLTEDASAAGRDLYRCEIPLGGVPTGCSTLTDISAPLEGSSESAEVQGLLPGLGADGSSAYFVAKGVLDTVPNGAGDGAVANAPNLYLWSEGDGVRFIATLSEEDASNWGGVAAATAASSVASSPSGRYLAFMSRRSLTGYDNRDVATDEPVQEVFRYDAFEDRLTCVSCNPSGAAPTGSSYGGLLETRFFDPRSLWDGRMLAAALPQPTLRDLNISLYQPRAVHDNGRVFFNAVDSLVPSDSNGEWDVYQHEPTGVGDCTASSGDSDTSRLADGCVSLISSGTAEEEAAFLDASEGGDDVFFLTPARLSVTDQDREYDVYDARVDGVRATLEPSAECLGEACQPAAVVPNDLTPASASFKGQGDPKPRGYRRCAKGKRLVRRNGKSRCLARRRKGSQQTRKHGKTSKERRASR
jgi:hypothetical protein